MVGEARGLVFAVRDEIDLPHVGPIVVSGMLAEQLAKELGVGAAPEAVVVAGAVPHGRPQAHVRIVAGDPSPEDEALVAEAAREGIEVVIVQLWPQADWTRPFVLSPFVVECRAGEGFPVEEIADRIVEATESASALAARVPVLAEALRSALLTQAVLRSALIGLAGSRLGRSRDRESSDGCTGMCAADRDEGRRHGASCDVPQPHQPSGSGELPELSSRRRQCADAARHLQAGR